MTAPIDLAALQARRDREVRAGRVVVQERVGALADLILKWAGRADLARVRLVSDDSEAAYAVSRWALRRLKGDTRRLLGRNLPDAVRLDALGLAEAAYLDRLRALETAGSEVAK